MATQIKRHCTILWVICLCLFSPMGLSQNREKPIIFFKIVNYKEYYKTTDSIILSVENTSDKPLFFTIGEESVNNGIWSSDILDLLASSPLEANIIKYKLIKPHKLNLITIYYKKRHYPLQIKKNGVSLPTRFILRYHNIDSIAIYNDDVKIASKVFKDRY
jgi:hypothetical protein